MAKITILVALHTKHNVLFHIYKTAVMYSTACSQNSAESGDRRDAARAGEGSGMRSSDGASHCSDQRQRTDVEPLVPWTKQGAVPPSHLISWVALPTPHSSRHLSSSSGKSPGLLLSVGTEGQSAKERDVG